MTPINHWSRRLFLPIFLFATWLLLNRSLAPGDIVLGLIIAFLFTWLSGWLRPLSAYGKKPLVALRLIWHVAVDIAKSNLAVGILVWKGRHSDAKPGFLKIPLQITDPHALAAMACIITYTPGTVWADYSAEDRILTLHVLDLEDEVAWRHTVQHRYERPLLEIFE